MKRSDIKKAYNSVKVTGELKSAIFEGLEKAAQQTDGNKTVKIPLETSPKRKGGFAAAVCAAAAVMILTVVGLLPNDPELLPESSESSAVPTVTQSETPSEPREMTHVTLRVLDDFGIPVENVRVDYLPMIITMDDPNENGWSRTYTSFDMENIDKAGTIPMTYGLDIELDIAYGEYFFYMSTALPNSQYRMLEQGDSSTILYYDSDIMTTWNQSLVVVDESTTEIILNCFNPEDQYRYDYPKLGVILRDAQGMTLPGYTVILRPKNGVMQPGFTDEYGGYVLTRTNENGEAFWRGNPINGEYEVIAYREALHPISEPIKSPFVFDGDDTLIYTKNDKVYIYEKTFTMAE